VIGTDVMNWIQLAQDRVPVAGFCKHGDEPLGSIMKAGCLTSWMTISFSKNILCHGVS